MATTSNSPLLRLLTVLLSSIVLVCCLVFLAFLSKFGMTLWLPVESTASTSLRVNGGDSLHKVLLALPNGFDPVDRTIVKGYAALTGDARKIHQGRFHIPNDWSPAQIFEQLAIGANDPMRLVLPPGLTLQQVAERVEESEWIEQAARFVQSSSGESVNEALGVNTLEGLFQPETYFFDSPRSEEQVSQLLFQKWKSFIEGIAGTSNLREITRNGLPLYETIILASVIEKEAAAVIEMATISSVFHNRIRKNWPLGSSATLRYAINDWSRGENELPVNLKSPFNTNRKPGLPPNPICVPSREAIVAALHPPDTPYMFFMADGQGQSVFNVTHEEHVRSARAYRRLMAEKKSAQE